MNLFSPCRKQTAHAPGISVDMPDPVAPNPNPTKRERDPNFMAVVAAAIIVVVLFFVGAWFLVHREGSHLLPKTHPDHEPHASLPAPQPSRLLA
jgi:hypothetical protein